jgi:hypothetical protein
VGLRYNPPPGWPPAPAGFRPEPGWQPDPSWPAPPPGWQLWVNDDQPPAAPTPPWAGPLSSPGQHDRSPGSSPETAGVYLTDGSYEDDDFYASPVGAADPGDFAAAAYASDSPASHSGRPSNPYDVGMPAYDNPASPPADSYSTATAYDSPASHPSDPYGTATLSQDTGSSRPGDGYSTTGWMGAGTGPPDGPYAGTWAEGSSRGGPAVPYGSDDRPLPGSKTSGWAIASLVIGICCGAVIGAALGIIALIKIRQTGQRGNLQAACGIVLSAFWTFLLIVVIVVATAFSGGATRGANGQISHSGKLNVFSLAVGDCFDNPTSQQDIASVTAVPCAEPHNAQVFATFDLPGSDSNYPGNLTQLASNGCNAQQDHLNQALVTDSMSIRFIYPVPDAWKTGERTVTCLVVTPANVSSSLLNR